jgi:peptidoglycan/xylan/chitin deacetylase (PgdA/CDA1 family)
VPRLALKVDVDTYRGTRYGVPRLVDMLKQHQADATFLFSLGSDHTGRAIKRVFRPGFFGKVSRTSVVSHYGFRTLLYGTLLPGPDIGRRCRDILFATRDAGFEVGVHCYDHIRWQDGVEKANAQWTATEMQRAIACFTDIFDKTPHVHGAAGWQMNVHALRLTQRLGFAYASDCRGTHPFVPVWNGEIVLCPQLPTTLPTLDELIGLDGATEENVHERLLALTATPRDHVFTLHAELEGMKLAHVLEKLLAGWKQQGYDLVALNDIASNLNVTALPRHELIRGEVPGRTGTLMMQGEKFLASWKERQ